MSEKYAIFSCHMVILEYRFHIFKKLTLFFSCFPKGRKKALPALLAGPPICTAGLDFGRLLETRVVC